MAKGIKTRRGESKGVIPRVIYDNGTEYDSISKNWGYGTHTFEKLAGNIHSHGYYPNTSNWNGCGYSNDNGIDFTSFKTLNVTFINNTNTNTGIYGTVAVRVQPSKPTTLSQAANNKLADVTKDGNQVNGSYTLSVDITSISGMKWFEIYTAGCSGDVHAYATKIWLE